jgi:hypothetical protein
MHENLRVSVDHVGLNTEACLVEMDHALATPPRTEDNAARSGKTIWIDLDNSPHVPFFAPIIKELRRCGYSVLLTARDAFQVK